MDVNIFFDSWQTLFRIIIAAIFVYLIIVILHRIAGKRATSQLNNFDWVVTVMIGSIGASTIVLKNVPILEGMVSIATLLTMQYLVTKCASLSTTFANLIYCEPKIVFYQGKFLTDSMRKERITRQEIECAMRSNGVHNFDDVAAVVFESDAKLTVISKQSLENHLDDDGHFERSDTIETIDKRRN